MSIVSYLDLALALPAALALAVPEPAQTPVADDLRLSATDALSLLPSSETIHVRVGDVGARWHRRDVSAAIKDGTDRRLALAARSAGFGLSFIRDTEESVLVQTDDAKVRAWLERQAKRAGE